MKAKRERISKAVNLSGVICLMVVLFLVQYFFFSNYTRRNPDRVAFGITMIYILSAVFLLLSFFAAKFLVCFVQTRRFRNCTHGVTGILSILSIAMILSAKSLESFYYSIYESAFRITVFLPAFVALFTTVSIARSLTIYVKKQWSPESFKWIQIFLIGIGAFMFFWLLHCSVYIKFALKGGSREAWRLFIHLPGNLLAWIISCIVIVKEKLKKEKLEKDPPPTGDETPGTPDFYC